jgi:hypothetical protein
MRQQGGEGRSRQQEQGGSAINQQGGGDRSRQPKQPQ